MPNKKAGGNKGTLAAVSRALARELVTEDDARRADAVDHMTAGTARGRLERVGGKIGIDQLPALDASMIATVPDAVSASVVLDDKLVDFAALLDLGTAIHNEDSGDSGMLPKTVLWPAGSITWDPDTRQMTVSFTAGGGSVAIQLDDAGVVSHAATIDFSGTFFAVTESPSGEANVTLRESFITDYEGLLSDELTYISGEDGRPLALEIEREVQWR